MFFNLWKALFASGPAAPGAVESARRQAGEIPDDFEAWGWQTFTAQSPWRGPMTIRVCPPEPSQGAPAAGLFVHGTGTDRWSMVRYMKPYRERGWALVWYDHPAPPSYGWYEEAELAWVRDQARLALARLAPEQKASPRLWVHHGESLGASVILGSLAAWPAPPGETYAAVADCPFTDFSQVLDERLARHVPIRWFRPWLLGRLRRKIQRRFGWDLEALKPGRRAAGAEYPLLLIHGLEDIRVLPVHSQELARVRPADLWLVPGARHCKSWLTAREEYERRVGAFLDRCAKECVWPGKSN